MSIFAHFILSTNNSKITQTFIKKIKFEEIYVLKAQFLSDYQIK